VDAGYTGPTLRVNTPQVMDELFPLADVRVLVVEDDPGATAVITRVLERCGASATCVSSGEDALRLVVQGDCVDVALVDHRLPGMTGTELTGRVRMAPSARPVPVIGMSGAPAAREMMSAGARCFVRKPADPAALVKAVRWAVRVYGDAR
jgi:CheY-like chemotaxis protein